MLKKDPYNLHFPSLFLTLLLLTFSLTTLAQEEVEAPSYDPEMVDAGGKLWKANCTQCHAIGSKVIGPDLKNVEDRLEKDWLIPWIQNSQAVIESGDEYANQIFEEYNKTVMAAFPFSDDEVLSILAFIDVESNKVVEVASTDAGGAVATEAGGGSGVSEGYMTAILAVLIVVLLLILVVLGLMVSVITNHLKSQKDLETEDEEVVGQKLDLGKLFSSNAFIGAAVFIFTAIVLKTLIDGAFTIGVQQGYQPNQPIAFSHAIHAGEYEIDCQYCHTGVRDAKSANIPSPNICMNCHVAIKTESPEIQKIFAAIDYDPETGQYGEETKPIEWVRIHNLPDLAYFNHSQHVEVGGIDCQTCHGPVEEMDVVYQYSTLTMGWCINCHRETDVNTKGNAYYDNLVELHSKKSKEPMKVEDIGGLECAKCHY